jgi:hypothetical protein
LKGAALNCVYRVVCWIDRWSQSWIALVRDPSLWFDLLAPMLLGVLGHHDPQLRDKLRAATALPQRHLTPHQCR